MKPTVYIETTIPNFYYETRTEADIVVRKQWTQEWWENKRHKYDLITSNAVLEELNSGNYPNKDKIIKLLDDIPLLKTNSSIIEIVQTYINHKLMPNNPLGDALHLSLASYYKSDFLLTWNCKNIANPNKFRHIQRINAMLQLYTPILTTPFQLLGGDLSWKMIQ